ncbi:hypothetical protein HDU98_012340 [Podochytrium sp. JEL0797]|nr:hypothetical protein HDU98_012340 [Podochytrium sp. JEL0797]
MTTTINIIKDLRETNQRLHLENQSLHTHNTRLESRVEEMDLRMERVVAMLEALVVEKKEGRRDALSSRLQIGVGSETSLCLLDEEGVGKSGKMDAQVDSSSRNWQVLSAVSHGDALCDWTSDDLKKTTGIGDKETDDPKFHSQTTLRSSVAQVARYDEIHASAASAAPTKMEVKAHSTTTKMEVKAEENAAQIGIKEYRAAAAARYAKFKADSSAPKIAATASTKLDDKKVHISAAAQSAKLKADSFASKMQLKDPALAAKFKANFKATEQEIRETTRALVRPQAPGYFETKMEIKANARVTLFKAKWIDAQMRFQEVCDAVAADRGHSCRHPEYALPCRCVELIRVPPLLMRWSSQPILSSELERGVVVHPPPQYAPHSYSGLPPFYPPEVLEECERMYGRREDRWTTSETVEAVGVATVFFTVHLVGEITDFVKRRVDVWLGRGVEV